MNELTASFIQMLQTLPNEAIGLLIYATALGSIFILHYLFGKEGLFLFIVIAIVLANLQSLKAIELSFFNYPLAMGSILFTMNLLALDILTEYYGKQEAIKAIWLGFSGMVMVTIFMLLTLGTKVIAADPNTYFYHYIQIHQAMTLLFTPTPALLLASLLAYLASQYTDMALFLWMKHYTNGRFLGLRTFLSASLSAMIDNSLFSFLAWKVFYPLPINFQTFLVTYIMGTFGLRVMVSIANMPFIYAIRRKSRVILNGA